MAGTLNIQIASDVHLEFYARGVPDDIIVPAAPVLALVGDIGWPHDARYEAFLMQQAERFDKVLVIAGNHEYYNNPEFSDALYHYDECNKKIEELCSRSDNLEFLQMKSVLIDGVRILGTTLWSAVPPQYQMEVQTSMNDYYLCRIEEADGTLRPLKVDDTNAWHWEERAWLEMEINKATDLGEPIAVLTHHAPVLLGSSHPKYSDSNINCAFSSGMEDLFRKSGTNVLVWAFGHTHYNNDMVVDGTRVVSNQLGYVFEGSTGGDWSSSRVIEVRQYDDDDPHITPAPTDVDSV